MSKIRYSRWTTLDWSELDLGELMGRLSDHLLQSGFQREMQKRWERFAARNQSDATGKSTDNALDELRREIARILRDSELLDEEQWQQLFSADGLPKDETLARMIDGLIARLLEEGYLSLQEGGESVEWRLSESGRLEFVRENSEGRIEPYEPKALKFEVTRKGIDFLGYKSLQQLIGALGESSAGKHETRREAPGIEAYEAAKPYAYGDPLQLDAVETFRSLLRRTGGIDAQELSYDDLRIRQSVYESSCATVLMLDCSHSMILYGEDRFTPAKKVALALAHLIRTQYPGDTLQVVLFHDGAETVSLDRLAQVEVGPYHTNTCEGLKLARKLLLAQNKEMRQIIMITDGKPSAIFQGPAESLGHWGGESVYGRKLYKNSMGLDPRIVSHTLAEARQCKRSGIMLNTFMITDDYYLVRFVEQLTETAEGRAYFSTVDQMGRYVMVDFIKRRRRQV